MKKFALLVLYLFVVINLFSYGRGQYEKYFTDPARNNRQIRTWIYYPIDENNPFATFPYLVFGHGFNGNCTSYTTFTNAMVDLGWIVAYPRTEEVFSFNTTDFAKDMAFLKDAVYMENFSLLAPIYNKIDTLAVVGGYSMGGACAVVAAYQQSSFNSLITLAAAAYLYSECTGLAADITMPSVTFSGSSDVIAAPSNQLGIYNNLASDYKSFVSLTGQGHTEFYNNGIIPNILNPWFSYLKTGSVYYIDEFEQFLSGYPGSSLTYMIENDLIINLDSPQNLTIDKENDVLEIRWDKILEAHGYRVFASDVPYSGFVEVTALGTISLGERITWTPLNSTFSSRFFYVKAYRD